MSITWKRSTQLSSKSNDSDENLMFTCSSRTWWAAHFIPCLSIHQLSVARSSYSNISTLYARASKAWLLFLSSTNQFSWLLHSKIVIYILQSYLALNKFTFANKWNMNSEAKLWKQTKRYAKNSKQKPNMRKRTAQNDWHNVLTCVTEFYDVKIKRIVRFLHNRIESTTKRQR